MSLDWNAIVIAVASPLFIFLGVWVSTMGKRDESRAERQKATEERLGKVEGDLNKMQGDLNKVQAYLRVEQRYSHRLVLELQGVTYYIREATEYRAAHDLPGTPPRLPDAERLEEILADRPSYDLD